MLYKDAASQSRDFIAAQGTPWQAIDGEGVTRMRAQNRFQTGLDIARHTASVMRADMAAYDADSSKFTQSLGCWSGFHAQQMIKSVKRLRGTTKGAYVYLSGWMVAGLRNRFGHLPDQSMHEKTSVVDLIEEIYVSLRQADEVAINDLFKALKTARDAGDQAHLTQLGTAIGSLAYIAPEVFDGQEATPASDIYALAVVTFEALTGRVPHPGATQAAAIKAALLDPPPLASTLDPSLPLGFDEVLARGLARDPAQRYATAGEFAAAAREALGTASSWSPTTVAVVPGPSPQQYPAAPTGPQTLPSPQPPFYPPTSSAYQSGPGYPAGPGHPVGYLTGPAYPSGRAPQPDHPTQGEGLRGVSSTIITAVIVAIALIGGAVIAAVLWNSDGKLSTTTTAPAPVTVTQTEAADPTTNAEPPPESTPCDTTVGVGTPVTSCQFAAAVRDAYLAAGPKGQARRITASSPVTGRRYTMNCLPEQGIVVCRGGNDAVVHIY